MSTGVGRSAIIKQRIITLLRQQEIDRINIGRLPELTAPFARRLLRGLTADEIAHQLGESALAIRPRLTELKQTNRVIATGERRQNETGKWAAVWEIYEPVATTSVEEVA
jgi:hypothetical protein